LGIERSGERGVAGNRPGYFLRRQLGRGAQSNPDANSYANPDSDANTDSDADPNANSDSNPDPDAHAHPDANSNADAHSRSACSLLQRGGRIRSCGR
jgi:hypothetical protein